MGMFKVNLDEHTVAQISAFLEFSESWDHSLEAMAQELGDAAIEYMKPLMHVRPNITNAAEDALRKEVMSTGNGFTIDFYSLWYVNYVDEGSPFEELYAYSFGLKGFPIDGRMGAAVLYSGKISGIGQGTSPYASQLPTHFSKRTEDYLAEDKANEIMFKNMVDFLDSVVIGE